jgi:hypothetical protein
MNSGTTATEHISLLESLNGEWFKLPLAVMQDVGPAVQTLAGLLKITNKETFSPLSDIAKATLLPAKIARNHLQALDEHGWIENCGRQHTRRGVPRRTATIRITKQTRDHIEPYGVLPWWACCSITKLGPLPWCAKAVLAVVMARLCSLTAAVENNDGQGLDADNFEGSLDNMGGEDRFRFSLTWLTSQTGLTHDSVVKAKRLLNHRFGIVRWAGTQISPGRDTPTDQLIPNWDFRVVVTPASEGHIYLAFDRGRKVGNREAKTGTYPTRKLGDGVRENWAIPEAKTGIGGRENWPSQ